MMEAISAVVGINDALADGQAPLCGNCGGPNYNADDCGFWYSHVVDGKIHNWSESDTSTLDDETYIPLCKDCQAKLGFKHYGER